MINMVKKVEEKKKRKFSFLIVIAVVLYVFAIVFIVFGIVKFREYLGMSLPRGILPKLENKGFKISFMNYSFEFNELTMAINYFVDAVVFFLWGTVFLIISGVFAKREKKTTEEKYILTDKIVSGDDKNVSTRVYCVYCETELYEQDIKCPNCGSTKKYKK